MLIPENIKIYFYLPLVDMRKSIDTLCILIANVLNLNPGRGHLFLFCSRSSNKIKILHYEPNCFTLWYRPLEKGRFIFPKNQAGQIEMTPEHFQWLLSSDKFSRLEILEAKYENYI